MRSTTKFEIRIIGTIEEKNEEKVDIYKLYEEIKAYFKFQNFINVDTIDVRRVNDVD